MTCDRAAVEERLVAAGRPAFLLDGDNLRHGLNGDLGFDEEARCENVRRTAHVARLFAESGTIALVSLVSPYGCDRDVASGLHAAGDLHFIEVFVDAPLEVCEERSEPSQRVAAGPPLVAEAFSSRMRNCSVVACETV